MLGSSLMNCFDPVKYTVSPPSNETLGRKCHMAGTVAAGCHHGHKAPAPLSNLSPDNAGEEDQVTFLLNHLHVHLVLLVVL